MKNIIFKERIFLLLFAFLLHSFFSFGQTRNRKADSPQAKVEQSHVTCKGVPYQDRSILGVVDFTVTASGATYKIGRGMSDMLSNALVECNCFRVVERDRLNKVQQEQALQGVDQRTAAQVNQLTGAQLLVMGNITEFQEKTGGFGGALVGGRFPRSLGVGGVAKTDAHVGMIIKVIHATTGEILVSKSLERKVSKIGVAGGGLFPVPAVGAFYKSKAMEDAIEETILEAVALIVGQKDALPSATYNEPVADIKPMGISLRNADFKSLMSLSKFLDGLSYVKQVDKKLKGNIGKLNIAYTADQESLMMDMVEKSGMPLEVKGFDDYSIQLELK